MAGRAQATGNGQISREIFVSEAVYRAEQERLLARARLFVGHESQTVTDITEAKSSEHNLRNFYSRRAAFTAAESRDEPAARGRAAE
jgi:hypothetical protein